MPQTKVKKPDKTAVKKPTVKKVKKITLDDINANFERIQKAHEETEKTLNKMMGELTNTIGSISENTLIPNLAEKFKKLGFKFEVINRQRKINSDEHDIHTEIDAFLENGSQAMAVEVKTTFKHSDVDYHVERMGKIRRHADLNNDKRQFLGAIAAAVIDEDTRRYALKQGFYIIEPSGENVKIVKPVSAKIW